MEDQRELYMERNPHPTVPGTYKIKGTSNILIYSQPFSTDGSQTFI